MKAEALTQITLHVTDLARARAFYGGQLGLEELPRPESLRFPGAWFRAGTVVVQLAVRAKADPPGLRGFTLWAENPRECAAALALRGLTVSGEAAKIPGVERVTVLDPDGNRIEFQGPDGQTWAV